MQLHGVHFSMKYKGIKGFGNVRYGITVESRHKDFSLPSEKVLEALALECALTGYVEESRSFSTRNQVPHRAEVVFSIQASITNTRRAAFLAGFCVKTQCPRSHP